MNQRNKTLYLHTTDRMIGGVCGGLARSFGIDPTLVRLAFVLFTVLGGGGVLTYVILWIVLEPAPLEAAPPVAGIDLVESPTPPAIDEPATVVKPAAAEEPAVAEEPAGDESPADVEAEADSESSA